MQYTVYPHFLSRDKKKKKKNLPIAARVIGY